MDLFEAKKDFSKEFEALSQECPAVVESKGLDEAVNLLLSLEKKCRHHSDYNTLKQTCVFMVKLCRTRSDWSKINAVLVLLNKRNASSKVMMTAVVEEAMSYIDSTPSIEVKVELIKTLKDICDGKIYVEGESAKLHMMLSKIYESQGDTTAACDIIQDVHVETYGSLSKQEKAEYILEQMRLNLLKKDYIRTMIHSRKMNTKTLEEIGFEKIKQTFYTMMIEYHSIELNTWEVCQAYYQIWNTGSKATDKKATETKETETKVDSEEKMEVEDSPEETAAKMTALESCVIFLLMSKYDNHQHDMMHRLHKQFSSTVEGSEIHISPVFKQTLQLFVTDEIIPTPFEGQEFLESHSSVHKISSINAELPSKFVTLLKDRVIQHNIRVVAKYYKRIRSARLCQLLRLTQDELEMYLSELSGDGDIPIRIDRPAGIITFQQKKSAEETLSDWSYDVTKMLQLTESTCHLINREIMVHKVQ